MKDVELVHFADNKKRRVNPDKFQAMIVSCDKKEKKRDKYK